MTEEARDKADNKSATRINKSTVDAAKLPAKNGRAMMWDSELKGFGVRIGANGRRTYILRYRMGGRDTIVRTYTIGQHGSPFTADQARKRAAELLLQVRSGQDIVAVRIAEREQIKTDAIMRGERLFEVAVESWFQGHVIRNALRSKGDIRGVIDRDLKPAFEGKAIDEMTRKSVSKALNEIGARSGAAANKAHKWLRQIFNWLIAQGEIEHSPVTAIKKPFAEKSRTRFLSLGELVVLWVALDRLPQPFRSYYRLLVILGQRLRETADVPWGEFDFEAEEWLLPRSRVKANRDHLVPLSVQAIELLQSVQADPAMRKGPVFTTNGKVGIAGFSKMKVAIDTAISELLAESREARELIGTHFAEWVIHDLRRSLATGCQAMGIDMIHTESVLNHAVNKTVSGVAGVYHLYDYYDEKAEALERWGSLIEQAVAMFRNGDVPGVLALDPARRAKSRRRRSLQTPHAAN